MHDLQLCLGPKSLDASPGVFEASTDLQQGNRRKNVTFGISREQNARRVIYGQSRRDPDVPGPGSYNPGKPLGHDSKKFSMGPKGNKREMFATPGPGSYSPRMELNRTGNYFLSRYQNSGACVFSPISSPRFIPVRRSEENLPGPGVYQPRLDMNNKGSYFFSKFKSTQASKFSKSGRDNGRRSINTPGPGSYRLPSAFEFRENRHILK